MTLLRNDNPHRIYFGDDTPKAYAPAGGIFEGSADDANRPGVSKVTKAEADQAEATQRGEGEDVQSVAHETAAGVHELTRQAALAGTAALRGEAPYQDPGTITTSGVPNSALQGADTGEASAAVQTGLAALSDAELDELEDRLDDERDRRAGQDGGEGGEDQLDLDDASADDLEEAYDKPGLEQLAKDRGVEFGTRDSKAKLAAKIVAARDGE